MRKLVIILLVVFWYSFATSSTADLPYLVDAELAAFSGWAEGMHRPLIISGLEEDDGGWEEARWLCSSPVIYATERYLYGLTVEHCVASTESRRIREIRAGDQVVTLTGYRPAGESTIRLWRTENVLGVTGQLIPIAQDWIKGEVVYISGYMPLGGGLEHIVTMGHINARKGWEELGDGTVMHSAPTWFGFSGGGAFVYNAGRHQFELLSLTEGSPVKLTAYGIIMSPFTLGYNIDPQIIEYIKRDAQDEPSRSGWQSHGRFANWDEVPPEVQRAWEAAYEQNAEYVLRPFSAVVVDGTEYPIGPEEAVRDAWLHDVIRVSGRLHEVPWDRFFYEIK